MPSAARLGDVTMHGGTLVWGEPTVFIGSRPAARLGDPHLCPMLDGPKPHVGGTVVSSSKSVWIGGALAARVGDRCGCPSAGTVGAGVPPIIGPGAQTRYETTDPQGRTAEELDEIQPATGPHAETEHGDWDRDGTIDDSRASASAARMRNSAEGDVGPVRFGVQHHMDVGYAQQTMRASADRGVGYHRGEEVGMVRHGGGVSVEGGSDNVNGRIAAGGEYAIATAESESDWLVGDDGRRIGIGGMLKAEAQAISAKAEVEHGFSIFGFAFESSGYVEGELGGAGGSFGGMVYYDTHEGRVHLNLLVGLEVLLGFEIGLHISLGHKYPALDWAVFARNAQAAVAPNVIVTGDPTVLIG